jgi:hypothetical protein
VIKYLTISKDKNDFSDAYSLYIKGGYYFLQITQHQLTNYPVKGFFKPGTVLGPPIVNKPE